MIVILDWVGSERLKSDIEECAKTNYNVFYILQNLHPKCQMHYVRLIGRATVDKFMKHSLSRYIDKQNCEELDKWMCTNDEMTPIQ